MAAAQRPSLEATAALMERAYGLALVLRDRLGAGAAAADAFEQGVLARELVALLDDARASMLRAANARPEPPC
jgi:hypothetical protein